LIQWGIDDFAIVGDYPEFYRMPMLACEPSW